MPSAKRGAVRNLRSPRLDSILSSLRVLGDDNNLQTYQAPTKKELLEARRETARLRSDMRASISTDATRPLDIKMLLKRFDVYVHNCTDELSDEHSHIVLSQKPACTFCAAIAAAVVGI